MELTCSKKLWERLLSHWPRVPPCCNYIAGTTGSRGWRYTVDAACAEEARENLSCAVLAWTLRGIAHDGVRWAINRKPDTTAIFAESCAGRTRGTTRWTWFRFALRTVLKNRDSQSSFDDTSAFVVHQSVHLCELLANVSLTQLGYRDAHAPASLCTRNVYAQTMQKNCLSCDEGYIQKSSNTPAIKPWHEWGGNASASELWNRHAGWPVAFH